MTRNEIELNEERCVALIVGRSPQACATDTASFSRLMAASPSETVTG